MKHAYLFDIDGVLCEPQQRMTVEMADAVHKLPGPTFLVTGNGYTKALDLLDCGFDVRPEGLFCNNADELRNKHGRLIWQDTETPPLPKILYPMPPTYVDLGNNFMEWRGPRFANYCPIGRFATKEQRDAHDVSWRPNYIEYVKNVLGPSVECAIGGQVSVDIYSKGADKSRAGKWLNNNGYTFTFIGDKTAPGGNDYPLAEYCRLHPENKCFTVTGPDDTLKLIEQILRGQDEAVSTPTPAN